VIRHVVLMYATGDPAMQDEPPQYGDKLLAGAEWCLATLPRQAPPGYLYGYSVIKVQG
jgi:hypothetical protein